VILPYDTDVTAHGRPLPVSIDSTPVDDWPTCAFDGAAALGDRRRGANVDAEFISTRRALVRVTVIPVDRTADRRAGTCSITALAEIASRHRRVSRCGESVDVARRASLVFIADRSLRDAVVVVVVVGGGLGGKIGNSAVGSIYRVGGLGPRQIVVVRVVRTFDDDDAGPGMHLSGRSIAGRLNFSRPPACLNGNPTRSAKAACSRKSVRAMLAGI